MDPAHVKSNALYFNNIKHLCAPSRKLLKSVPSPAQL